VNILQQHPHYFTGVRAKRGHQYGCSDFPFGPECDDGTSQNGRHAALAGDGGGS
jgi:hypothetical protein